MNILLIQSSLGPYPQVTFPLGLAYLAACLPDHTVKILDLNTVSPPNIVLRNTIKDFQPDVIGLSFRNTDDQEREFFRYFYRDNFKAEVQIIKQLAPQIPLVVGGSAFSLYPYEIMENNPSIDFGIYLEGELSFPALIANMQAPSNVKGVFFRENGTIRFSGPAELPDFKNLPLPRRDLVDLARYTPLEGIGIQTTRGCYHKCIYCVYPFLSGEKLRCRSPESVVDEIEELVRNHGTYRFFFADSSFAISMKHARGICEEILNRGLRVQWGAYFDMQCDEAFLRLAKKAGCTWFVFSPDGYSNAALSGLGKKLTHQGVKKHLEMMFHHPEFKDVDILYCFMVNTPGETLAGFLRTFLLTVGVKLRAKMGSHKRFNVAYSKWIRIEPNTEVYRISCRQGDIRSQHELLPENPTHINNLFYRHPQLHDVDGVILGFRYIWRMVDKLRKRFKK